MIVITLLWNILLGICNLLANLFISLIVWLLGKIFRVD